MEESESLAKTLAIVGLYRVVELTHKKILKQMYKGLKEEDIKKKIKSLDKWDVFKNSLQVDCGVNINDVNNNIIIDELRILNNLIKHSSEGIDSENINIDKYVQVIVMHPICQGKIKLEIG